MIHMFGMFNKRQYSFPLTFPFQDVVSWEHDAAAHDVTFEAARTKSISDPAAVEDLPVIYERRRARNNLTCVFNQFITNAFMFVLFVCAGFLQD